MNNYELYLNDSLVEIDEQTKIAMNLQVNDLADIADRNVSYSNTISIPKTSKNKQLFGYLGITGNSSLTPYVEINMRLIVSLVSVIKIGLVSVQDTEKDYYRVLLIDGLTTLKQSLEGKTLADLNYSDLNHSVSLANIKDKMLSTVDSGYIYSLADFGGLIINEDKLNGHSLYPSVFVHTLIDKIFALAGYSYESDFFDNNADYRAEVVPAIYVESSKNNLDLGQVGYSVLQGEFTDTPYTGWRLMYWFFNFTTIEGFEHNQKILNTIDVGSEFRVQKTGFYKITVTASIPYFDTGVSPFEESLKLYIGWDESLFRLVNEWADIDLTEAFAAANNIDVGETFTYTNWLLLTEGDDLQFILTSESGEAGATDRIRFSAFNITVELTTSEIPYGGQFNFAERIYPADCMEFLKGIMQQFGIVATQLSEKVYAMSRIEDIFNMDFGFDDWSKKLTDENRERYSLGDYARINKLKYEHLEDRSTFGNGQIEIQSNSLPYSKDLFNSLFGIAESFGTTIGLNPVVTIPLIEVDSQSGVRKINEINFPLIVSLNSGELVNALTVEFTDVNTSPSFTHLAGAVLSYLDSDPVKWEYLIDGHYQRLSEVLNRAQVKEVKLLLNITDIRDLDFRKLKYFKQYQAYFYLNKIKNWINRQECVAEIVNVSKIN